jgi:hypothetical protein
MSWEITLSPETERWFMSLGQRDAEKIAGAIDRLAEHGPSLGRPAVDSVNRSRHHNMKELRSFGGNLRVLFAFDPRRKAVLLTGGDKTNNWKGWYRDNIPKADRLFDEYLRREGPWDGPGGRSGGRER